MNRVFLRKKKTQYTLIHIKSLSIVMYDPLGVWWWCLYLQRPCPPPLLHLSVLVSLCSECSSSARLSQKTPPAHDEIFIRLTELRSQPPHWATPFGDIPPQLTSVSLSVNLRPRISFKHRTESSCAPWNTSARVCPTRACRSATVHWVLYKSRDKATEARERTVRKHPS